jgi:FkbM family methyltransferase
LEVAFLSTWRSQCGIASYTANLKSALDSAGVVAHVEPIDRKRIHYLTRPELKEHFRGLARSMRDADIVHVQHEFALFAGGYGYGVSMSALRAVLRELARIGKPTVITLHTDPFAMFGPKSHAAGFGIGAYMQAHWRSRMMPLFRTTGLEAIVHTRASRRAAIDSGIPDARVEVIRHGVPAHRRVSEAERQAVRRQLGYVPETKLLAIFGFLEPYKGYTTVIDSLARLPEDFQLAIVGGVHPFSESPASETILAELERRPALRDRVTVRGFVPASELAAFQSAADICLAPYRRGTPMSASGGVTWALASGKPVIASALPAFVELRDYVECLEVVTPDAPRELAQTVRRLTDDPGRAQELVFQAHRYCSLHSWEATATAHAALYERVCRQRPSLTGRLARLGPARLGQALARRSARAIRLAAQPEADGLVYATLRAGRARVTFALDPDSEDQLVQSLIRNGYPSEPGALLMQTLLGPGDVMIDLGAHVGTFALAAAARGCRVVAIDADPAHIRSLQASVARNQFRNVTVVHAAASDRTGSINFVPNGIWGHVRSNGSEASYVEVPATPVGKLLDELGIDRVAFIKMDIEGSELQAVEGMLPVLTDDDAPAILFESNAPVLREVSGVAYQDLHARLEELGFQLYVVDLERVGRLVPIKAGDFMPHAVLEYFAAKRLPEDIFPWSVAEPFSQEELARRLVQASGLDSIGYRAYAASVIASGPDWLRADPRVEQARLSLLDDEAPEVRDALTSR